jgi:hypothetical protein
MNNKQKENTAKALLDLAKAVVIGFVIGGFIPGSLISTGYMFWGLGVAMMFYGFAMLFLKED